MKANHDDVIRTSEKLYLMESELFSVDQLLGAIQQQVSYYEDTNIKLICSEEGLECKFLSTSGGGWKKARFRLAVDVTIEENHENELSSSDLDDIRQQSS